VQSQASSSALCGHVLSDWSGGGPQPHCRSVSVVVLAVRLKSTHSVLFVPATVVTAQSISSKWPVLPRGR
jgi:hypothetical protein